MRYLLNPLSSLNRGNIVITTHVITQVSVVAELMRERKGFLDISSRRGNSPASELWGVSEDYVKG